MVVSMPESVIDRSEILRMILFGRTSCRSRSKNNYKILLLTGAQDLLFGQDLLPEQELPNRTESLINNHVELYFACIFVKYLPICIRIELVLSTAKFGKIRLPSALNSVTFCINRNFCFKQEVLSNRMSCLDRSS